MRDPDLAGQRTHVARAEHVERESRALVHMERLVFRRAVIRALDSGRVRGAAYGEAFDRNRHRSGTNIKAVTFHQLKVEPTRDGFSAQVFLDL